MPPIFTRDIQRTILRIHHMVISCTYTGLSPSMVRRSRRLLLPWLRLQMVHTPHLFMISHKDSVCPIPFSFATTSGISFDFFSSPYWDASVQEVPFPFRNGTECQEVPFSNLRIQEIHASPRNLSQLVTTFFGSRAEPSPSRVVASYWFLHSHFLLFILTQGLIVSPLVSRHINSGISDHSVSPQGEAVSTTNLDT